MERGLLDDFINYIEEDDQDETLIGNVEQKAMVFSVHGHQKAVEYLNTLKVKSPEVIEELNGEMEDVEVSYDPHENVWVIGSKSEVEMGNISKFDDVKQATLFLQKLGCLG